MKPYDTIIQTYPELEESNEFHPERGSIALQDDGDGIQYIKEWNYSKPIPEGLSLGKP